MCEYQGFCTKIWPLKLQGVLVVQFRGKKFPSFTAGVLCIPRANLDSVSEPYIWATFSERPYNRDDTAALLELPQKIEVIIGSSMVKAKSFMPWPK